MNTVIRCPVCKAENAQGPACRRCKADLALLWALEERRAAALAAARRRLAAGRADEAAALAEEADRMRSGEDSRRLRAVTRLVQRDYAGAWASYREWGAAAPDVG